MFDFSFSEILLAGLIALIVLGPERLPKVARQIGLWVGKAKTMAANIQNELNQQSELNQLRDVHKELQQTTNEINQELQQLPAWEKLPPQRTPADFGIDTSSSSSSETTQTTFLMKSLHKQAMTRKRTARPHKPSKPRLRSRK